jgi:hypothetical protein
MILRSFCHLFNDLYSDHSPTCVTIRLAGGG